VVFSYTRYRHLLEKKLKYGDSVVYAFSGETGQNRISLVLTVYKSFKFRAGKPKYRARAVAQLVEGTTLPAGRSRVRFPMTLLEFFIDIILLTALWP